MKSIQFALKTVLVFLQGPVNNALVLVIAILVAMNGVVGSVPGDVVGLGTASNMTALQVGNGTASAPSLSFTSDTDTGLYRIGANNMAWSAGGTLAFDINSTGTVDFAQAPTFAAAPIYASESITPTDNGVITITANLVTLTPAGAVTDTLAACTTGKWAVLYNSINANVIITDTGNFIGAGNATLGQYDAMPLACIDSKWVQIAAVVSN